MNLAEALIAFVNDVAGPFLGLLEIVCWVSGLMLVLIAALRMLKHSDSFGKGAPPSAMGTLATFMAGIILLQLPAWMNALTVTFFGTAETPGRAVLGYGGVPDAGFTALLEAVFTIVALTGLIAFIKGIFVLRACSDGKPSATAGQAAMHIVGGAAAWHIVAVIDAVQTTLGIQILDIS